MGDEARENVQRRIDEIRHVYERHGILFRIVWIAAAVVVLLVGMAMTVLPGPAIVVLPLGLAMLAVVSGLAHRLLLFGVGTAEDAVAAWKRTRTWIKLATVAAVAAGAGGVAAWILF